MQRKNSIWLDQFGREKRKLRISVTDRCNFKCQYCMPEHPKWMDKKHLLDFEALYQFCELMVQGGIQQIRITGGEPLMRKGIIHFIQQLQQLKSQGLQRIAMTTNAHYLKQYAQALQDAGLDDLNISLDSLDETQFQQMTQSALAPVLAGIEQALAVGLKVKINTVLMKGVNDCQILPLTAWAQQKQVMLRFIEYMPLDGDTQWCQQDVVTEQQILQVLAEKYQIESIAQDHEPARYYRLDLDHQIGIISTISHTFCGACDRLRLTAKGELYNCLFATQGLALKDDILTWQYRPSRQATTTLIHKIQNYIWHKAAGFHEIQAKQQPRKITMHMLGG